MDTPRKDTKWLSLKNFESEIQKLEQNLERLKLKQIELQIENVEQNNEELAKIEKEIEEIEKEITSKTINNKDQKININTTLRIGRKKSDILMKEEKNGKRTSSPLLKLNAEQLNNINNNITNSININNNNNNSETILDGKLGGSYDKNRSKTIKITNSSRDPNDPKDPRNKLIKSYSTSNILSDPLISFDDEDPNITLPTEDGLIYTCKEGTMMIRAGTKEKLVEKLFVGGTGSIGYSTIFLFTYRSFMSPIDLLKMLIDYFKKYMGNDVESKKMRLKITSFMKTWIDKQFHDWEEDTIQTYTTFLDEVLLNSDGKTLFEQLKTSLLRQIDGKTKVYEKVFDKETPTPVYPKMGWKLTDLDTVEFARQMTILESQMYQKIQPKEYLNKAFQSNDKQTLAPNVYKFIQRFNSMGLWIAKTILEPDSPKERAVVIDFWINVSKQLLKLNNFNGTMEVLAGLGHGSVSRLRETWDNVSKKTMKKFSISKEFMSPQKSYGNYRREIRNRQPPLVPYIGVYMSDMVFIEDGNKDYLSESYINFYKRKLLADVIREIQQFQQEPYNLRVIPEIRIFLQDISTPTEDVLYERSKNLEQKK